MRTLLTVEWDILPPREWEFLRWGDSPPENMVN